jgi:cation/acetate symporter
VLVIHFGGLPGRAALFGNERPRAPHALTVKLPGPQKVTFPAAAHLTIAGRPVTVAAGAHRTLPGGTDESSPLLVYSLLVATFLGTMGLPHILVRFYTNPDGHAARRTRSTCSRCWGCSMPSPRSTARWAGR